MSQWFYGENGAQHGPLDGGELERRIAAGQVGPGTLLWREGMPSWQPLATVQASGMLSPQWTPYQVYAATPPTSGLAIASLVCGILGLVTCFLLAGIPAVICGHLALGKIRHSPVPLAGHGMAIAGLICGYLAVLGMVAFVAILLTAMISASP